MLTTHCIFSRLYLARCQRIISFWSALWQPVVEFLIPVVNHIAGNQQQGPLVWVVSKEGVQEGNGLQ